MTGAELCEALKLAAGVTKDTDLARMIGFANGSRITQLKSNSVVKTKYAAKLFKLIATAQIEKEFAEAIQPVVEFFPITAHQTKSDGRWVPFEEKSDHGKKLASTLAESRGVYSFYNSEGEIIYFGRTVKQTLYDEMVNTYNRVFPKYRIFRVRHPWERYKSKKDDELRHIKNEQAYLVDTASYFSAYSVSDRLIVDLEALFIRISPNDNINVKMERGKLKSKSTIPPEGKF